MRVSSSLKRYDSSMIDEAVLHLKQGDLVAFPTETVYGLGADASNPEALARLFAAKGRPASHPVIVHLASAEMLDCWAAVVPETARRLAEAFWPGPLTIVLPRSDRVLDQVTGGQDTVALRIPNHPLALQLLESFGGGLAAPSANRFGHLSPTRADHVLSEMGDAVAMVLDGGPCRIGIESTIVDVTGPAPRILRPGMILSEEINSALLPYDKRLIDSDSGAPRVPGGLPVHYAPTTPLLLVCPEAIEVEASRLHGQGKRFCVLGFRQAGAEEGRWFAAPSDPGVYARELYDRLRVLDGLHLDAILVERVPEGDDWSAIRDRLSRAATFNKVDGREK